MKIIVFDLGGTLMEYTGMPLSWAEYYRQGFEHVNRKYSCGASKSDIEKSVEILKSFNPRINYREQEFAPEYIFQKALDQWHSVPLASDVINTFYDGLALRAKVYPDTIPVLTKLKNKGYIIAAFTDLPTAMPDERFRKDIRELLEHIDLYVSSLTCGFRKPNMTGLQIVANHYNVPVKELLYVGDEEKDRKTALNAGCRYIHIDRQHSDDRGISSLRELYGKLAD